MTPNSPAKQLFWDYCCSSFGIDHDGVRAEYLALGGGDPVLEKEWRREFVEHWLSKISTDDEEPLRRLRSVYAVEAIPSLLEMNDYGDDYMKFWFAFTLYDLAEANIPNDQKKRARAKAKALWEEIVSSPKGITSAHGKLVTPEMLEGFNAKTPEDYVRNYALIKLNRS